MTSTSQDARRSRSSAPGKTSAVLILAAWLVVGLPLAWGLYTSVRKALPLFTSSAAASASTPAAPLTSPRAESPR